MTALSDEEKQVRDSIAAFANDLLNSHRDSFTIGPQTFAAAVWREPENDHANLHYDSVPGRVVSRGAIRLILDWASSSWPMSLGDFLSGMFHAREWDQTTPPWKLIPEAKDRLSADSLGFGHLYPAKET